MPKTRHQTALTDIGAIFTSFLCHVWLSSILIIKSILHYQGDRLSPILSADFCTRHWLLSALILLILSNQLLGRNLKMQNGIPPANRTDVLICGSGSAGVTAALWLALHNCSFKVLEKRPEAMKMGQADGVQCRTVEIFESFGVSEEMLREAYHVLEVAFWSSDAAGKLRRTRTTGDTAPGLTHMPHVILNQARVNGLLLEAMKRANGQDVDYGWTVKGVEVDSEKAKDPEAYAVKVTAEKNGKEEVFEAKYVLVSLSAQNLWYQLTNTGL
jgi:hypothetical protein